MKYIGKDTSIQHNGIIVTTCDEGWMAVAILRLYKSSGEKELRINVNIKLKYKALTFTKYKCYSKSL